MEAKILTRLVKQLMGNGKTRTESRRIAIAALQKSGNLKEGSTRPTTLGITRGNMTPGERAIDRAKTRDIENGIEEREYKYNPHNNTAVLGKVNSRVKKRA